MKNLKLGQFIVGNSLIHQLDPRTKIICSLVVILSVLFGQQWFIMLTSIVILLTGMVLSDIRPVRFLKGLRKLTAVLLLSFVLQALVTPGTPVLLLGSHDITREGLLLGTSTAFRLALLYLCSSLLTMTTSPVKLASGLERLLAPLQRLKLPVHQLSLITSTALRFIPTIIEEAELITRAQKCRGAKFGSPKLKERLYSFIPVLIPLLANSLQRANDLALAMESRCYTGGPNPSRTGSLCYQRADRVAIVLVISCFIFSYAVNTSYM